MKKAIDLQGNEIDIQENEAVRTETVKEQVLVGKNKKDIFKNSLNSIGWSHCWVQLASVRPILLWN